MQIYSILKKPIRNIYKKKIYTTNQIARRYFYFCLLLYYFLHSIFFLLQQNQKPNQKIQKIKQTKNRHVQKHQNTEYQIEIRKSTWQPDIKTKFFFNTIHETMNLKLKKKRTTTTTIYTTMTNNNSTNNRTIICQTNEHKKNKYKTPTTKSCTM